MPDTRRNFLKKTGGVAALLTGGRNLSQTAEAALEPEWSQRQNGEKKQGTNTNTKIPTTNIESTQLHAAGTQISSEPVISGSKVFVGGRDGQMRKVNSETGSNEWSYQTDNRIEGTPALLDGTLYFGNESGKFIGLDAETGTEKFNKNLDAVGLRSMTHDGENLFFRTSGQLMSTDKNGNIAWNKDVEIGDDGTAMDGDNLLAVDRENNNLKFYDKTTGEQTGKVNIGERIGSGSPAIIDGSAFVDAQDTLYQIDVDSTNIEATYSIEGGIPSPVVTDDGKVAVLGNSQLRVLENGTEVWSQPVEGYPSAMASDGEKLVVANEKVEAIDLEGGEILWDENIDGRHRYLKLSVANDQVYAARTDGVLEVFSGDTLPENVAPDARFSIQDDNLLEDTEVGLDASSSSDSDGSIESYEWSIDGAGNFSSRGENAVVFFDEAGEYEIQLTVTDDDGASDTEVATVDVEDSNQPPSGDISVDGELHPGNTLAFSSNASDPDGAVEAVAWDYDQDGEYEADGRQIEHEFAEPGTYTVSARITDNEGETTILEEEIEITEEMSQDILDHYDGEDDEFQADEIVDMIVDYNTDSGRDPTTQDIIDAIVRYNTT